MKQILGQPILPILALLLASGATSKASPSQGAPGATGTSTIISWSGCYGTPQLLLSTTATAAPIGGVLPMTVSGITVGNPLALFYGQQLAVDASGCGLLVPTWGEVLLELSPYPTQFSLAVPVNGTAQHTQLLPTNPALLGKKVAIQCLVISFTGTGVVELSNALEIEFTS